MMPNHHILIVDDDADDREMMKDAFLACKNNRECITLENGEKLLEYLEQTISDGSPALILLDLNMPGKDGREILRDLKSDKRFSPIPTVVFTTSSAPRDRIMSYELGANCFITKPDTFNKLAELAESISRLWLQ